MKMKAIQQDILKSRPAVDPTWIIFNAPRPIYGHSDWKGDFSHGTFYAAVDPNGEHAADFIKGNLQLDAQVCRFVTIEEIKAWAQELCEREGYDFSEMDELDMRCSYFGMADRREITL